MARAVEWQGSNSRLEPPPGHHGHVSPVATFRTDKVCVTCWELDAEEIAQVITSGGRLFVSVFYGGGMPPIFVGSEQEVRALLADYGPVWRKTGGGS